MRFVISLVRLAAGCRRELGAASSKRRTLRPRRTASAAAWLRPFGDDGQIRPCIGADPIKVPN